MEVDPNIDKWLAAQCKGGYTYAVTKTNEVVDRFDGTTYFDDCYTVYVVFERPEDETLFYFIMIAGSYKR